MNSADDPIQAPSPSEADCAGDPASLTELIESWIELLSFVRPRSANRVLLTDYFLEKFSAAAQPFFHLLVEINALLCRDELGDKERTIAEHYLKVLSPLAERFGIYEEK